MNPNKALWEKGDFTEIAAFMHESGEAVVKSIAQNQGTNGGTSIPATFLRVTVSV